MIFTAIGLGVFGVLLFVSLPNARVRNAMLTAMHRVAHLAVLLAILGCATLFVRPELAPPPVAESAATADTWLTEQFPDVMPTQPDAIWPMTALALVIVSMPLLALIDYARRITGHTVLVARMRRELLTAVAALEQRLAKAPHGDPGGRTMTEARSAAAVLRGLGDSSPHDRPRPRLVKDVYAE